MGLFTMFTSIRNDKNLTESLHLLSFKQLLEENKKLRDRINDMDFLRNQNTPINNNNCMKGNYIKGGTTEKKLILDYSNDIVKVIYSTLHPTKEEVFQMIEALLQLKTID